MICSYIENKCLYKYIYSIKNKGMNIWGAQLKKVKNKAFNVPRSRLYGQTAFPLKGNYGPSSPKIVHLFPYLPLVLLHIYVSIHYL